MPFSLRSVAAILSVLLFPNAFALSWKQWNSPVDRSAISDQIANSKDMLSKNEIDALFLNVENLGAYSRRPDCFHKAAISMRNRCGESEISEYGRVRAAISMTLCELATAKHYSPPLECVPFSSPSHILDPEDVESQADWRCLEVLNFGPAILAICGKSLSFASRIAVGMILVYILLFQSATPNTQTTRNIFPDTAKSIYLNATLEKLTLIGILKQREMRMMKLLDDWSSTFSDLSEFSKELRGVHSDQAEILRDVVANMATTLLNVEDKLAATFSEIQNEHRRELDRRNSEMTALMTKNFEQHTNSLNEIALYVETSLAERLRATQDLAVAHVDSTFKSLSQVEQRWAKFDMDFSGLARNLLSIADLTNRTIIQLNSGLDVAITQQHLQLQASDAIHELTHSVELLTSLTRSELHVINETTYNIRNQLSFPLYFPLEWWQRCIEIMFKINPAYLNYLYHLPILRVSFQLISVSWWLLQPILALITGVFVVRTSSARKTERPANMSHAIFRSRFLYPVAAHYQGEFAAPPPIRRRLSRIPARLYKTNSTSYI